MRRLLRHQKAAKGRNRDGVGDLRRHQIGEGAARPSAGVIDDDIGRADLALDHAEQPLDLVGLRRVASKGAGLGLRAECAELFDLARGERDLDAFAREQPRQRCAQPFAGADDEGGLVLRNFHGRDPRMVGTWYLSAQSGKATRGREDQVEIPLVGQTCVLRAQHA